MSASPSGTPSSESSSDDKYDAFLSHRSAFGAAAKRLERDLDHVARRYAARGYAGWRPPRVWLDSSSLLPSASLPGELKDRLRRSRFLVVLLDANTASSNWVNKEIEFWLDEVSDIEHLLVVVVDSALTLRWVDGRLDPDEAVPPALRGRHTEEPVRTNYSTRRRLRRVGELDTAVSALCARLLGIELAVEAEHRADWAARRLRIQGFVGTALVILLVLAVVAAGVAVKQRNIAVQEARVATARLLATEVGDQATAHLDVSQLLAAAAFQQNPNPQSRAALIATATTSPALVRFLAFPVRVNAVAGSDDGTTVLVGLEDGRVMRWRLTDPTPKTVLTLAEPVHAVASDSTGTVVMAAGRTTAQLGRPDRPPVQLDAPDLGDPNDPTAPADAPGGSVAVSPSGGHAAVDWPGKGSPGAVTLVDGRSGAQETHSEVRDSLIQLPSDDEVVVVDQLGGWAQRRTADWSTLAEGVNVDLNFSVRAMAISRDGLHVTGYAATGSYWVWPNSGGSLDVADARPVVAPVSYPGAMAVNRDGSEAAITDGGVIYVSLVVAGPPPGNGPAATSTANQPAPVQFGPVTPAPSWPPSTQPSPATGNQPLALSGANGTITDGLAFFGAHGGLLSASGKTVAVWDPGQVDRLAHITKTADIGNCPTCDGPEVAIAPDGRQAALTFGPTVAVESLDGPQPTDHGVPEFAAAPPVWLPDGTLVVPTEDDSDPTAANPTPGVVTWPVVPGIVASAATPDGRVVFVGQDGMIHVVDGHSGRELDTLSGQETPSDRALVAVSGDGNLVAVGGDDGVVVTDLRNHAVVGRSANGATGVTFAGSRLLIQRADGTLDVFDDQATTLQRTLPGDDRDLGVFADPSGTMAARLDKDGSLDLVDLGTGLSLGHLPAAATATRTTTGAAFAPSGRVLVTETDAYPSSVLTTRDLSDDALIEAACHSAGRNLTAGEWMRYVGTAAPGDLTCGR
jgi:hypothetical protein